MAATVTPEDIDDLIINAAWAICSTHHTILNATPGAAIFGRDMLFDIPYIVDWKAIGLRRQARVDKDALHHNVKRIDYDYAVGEKFLLLRMVFCARQRINTLVPLLLHRSIQMEPSGFSVEKYPNA